MQWRNSAFYFLLITYWESSSGFTSEFSKCQSTDLVVYNLIFETHWTRQKFPKQYPENRPPAHWSKLIGMTHNENYVLFRIGEIADKDFKVFAETGKTDILDTQQKFRHVFDEFSSASIKTGAGRTEVRFFVDANHTMVSLAVRIIPSPDWFVGVDSLALCSEGNWLDSITIEASPIDAGTDSGFTFTAPNWVTEPQERISKITSKYPKHPANSFYYPKLQDLPVIATFHIVKKKLYKLTRKMNILEVDKEAYSEVFPIGNQTPILNQSAHHINNEWNNNSSRIKYKKFHKNWKMKKHGAKTMLSSKKKQESHNTIEKHKTLK